MIILFLQDFFFLIILSSLIFYVFSNFLREPILNFFASEKNKFLDLRNDSEKMKIQAEIEKEEIKKVAAANSELLKKVERTKQLVNKQVDLKFEVIKKNSQKYKVQKKQQWESFCKKKQISHKVDKLIDLTKAKIISDLLEKNNDKIMSKFIKRLH